LYPQQTIYQRAVYAGKRKDTPRKNNVYGVFYEITT
jgi:hypothetical protein